MKNVVMSYRPGLPAVLKGMCVIRTPVKQY
jgi:hypothetical protein